MAALLVSLSIMSIMLTVAMPVWKQLSTREKEAELVFRGEQYARAIGLFQRKAGPGVLPPTLDVLVQQKFLRKAYKDPITGEDFVLIRQGQAPAIGPGGSTPGSSRPGMSPSPDPQSPAGSAGAGRGRGASGFSGGPTTNTGGSSGFGGSSGSSGFGGSSAFGQISNSPGGAVGGIQGVASKSTGTSIRQYNGRTRYNQWEFVYVQQAQAPGAGGPPGTQNPGQRGAPPGLPGGPGGPGGPGRGGFGRSGPGRGMPSGSTFPPLTPQPPVGSDQRPPGAPPPPPQ
jgi:type II secretory pathway pseudopilin PulG